MKVVWEVNLGRTSRGSEEKRKGRLYRMSQLEDFPCETRGLNPLRTSVRLHKPCLRMLFRRDKEPRVLIPQSCYHWLRAAPGDINSWNFSPACLMCQVLQRPENASGTGSQTLITRSRVVGAFRNSECQDNIWTGHLKTYYKR